MLRLVILSVIMLCITSEALSQLRFEGSASHNFGEVVPQQEMSHTFKFINESSEPIVIIEAKSSCSCIKASAPRAPIMGGESGEITITYRSGRKDRGTFSKVVEIITSGEPSRQLLTLTGEVNYK